MDQKELVKKLLKQQNYSLAAEICNYLDLDVNRVYQSYAIANIKRLPSLNSYQQQEKLYHELMKSVQVALGGYIMRKAILSVILIFMLGILFQPVTARAAREDDIVALMNNARAQQGLSAVSLDDTLTGIAKTRAAECSKKFSHIRPNGKATSTFFKLLPVQPRKVSTAPLSTFDF